MKNLVVIKIGTALLTDRDGRIKLSFLGRVCEEIAGIKGNEWNVILVSSGAVASGVGILNNTPHNIVERSVYSCVGQVSLMDYYRDFFGVFGIITAQALLTWRDLKDTDTRILVKNNISKLLEIGVLPIVNENDLTSTEELSFGDNDQLAAKVSLLFNADKLVILSDVDGLYDKNPQKHKEAKRFDTIEEMTIDIKSCVDENTSEVSLGGMTSKLLAAKIAADGGIETIITSGIEARNTLPRIILYSELLGTKFLAQSQ